MNISINSSVWNHIAMSYNNASYTKLYLNDVEAASTISRRITPDIYEQSGGSGRQNTSRTFDMGRSFGGTLDEIRLWNTTLSAAQLILEGNSQYPQNYTGLVASWPSEQGTGAYLYDTRNYVPGKYNTALLFNDVGDYAQLALSQTNYTMMLWYKNLSSSTWTQAANVSGTYYVNGNPVSGVPYLPISANASHVFIGKTSTGTYHNGTIDDARIYSRPLTANEIKANYYEFCTVS
jgi:hypothetical protein